MKSASLCWLNVTNWWLSKQAHIDQLATCTSSSVLCHNERIVSLLCYCVNTTQVLSAWLSIVLWVLTEMCHCSKDKHKSSEKTSKMRSSLFVNVLVELKTEFYRGLLFSLHRRCSSDISRAWNAFFSICFPKSSHPFWGSLFALRTSVTVSELAGTTLNSSAGTSASHSHLCPGPPNPPLSLSTFLSVCLSPSSVFSLQLTHWLLQTHTCMRMYNARTRRTHYSPQSMKTAKEFHITYKWQMYYSTARTGSIWYSFPGA